METIEEFIEQLEYNGIFNIPDIEDANSNELMIMELMKYYNNNKIDVVLALIRGYMLPCYEVEFIGNKIYIKNVDMEDVEHE